MKNKVLKTFYGVMLSAVLVITASIPALAANCDNGHNLQNGSVSKVYVNASESGHQIRETTSGTCTVCGTDITVVNTYPESHTPDANGKCIACGYQVWHRP